MSPLSTLDLALLAGFCTLLFAGAILSLLVLRVALIRLEDATATYEILREHPDLAREQQWTAPTDSVSLTADPEAWHEITTRRAA